MIKTHKKFTLEDLEHMTWRQFKKMINGTYPLEACTFEFPEGIKFDVFLYYLNLEGFPVCKVRTREFDYMQFNEAIKEYSFLKETYEKDEIACYINLTLFYPGIDDKEDFAYTLMFDYIY